MLRKVEQMKNLGKSTREMENLKCVVKDLQLLIICLDYTEYNSILQHTYTTPSTVKEVSAMFVATMNLLQFGGGGLNTRICKEEKNIREQEENLNRASQ